VYQNGTRKSFVFLFVVGGSAAPALRSKAKKESDRKPSREYRLSKSVPD
jgi:hypothetical protein